ncbi:CPBP family intramembrane glutamic endopeptidase [Pseudomaricurvus sp. HS19]|uniref:CPBP family intramembrane glutamic endopeptidase n=1 Tax=Pseudomaricurvus sp. HS19 TaxID=2692626 RepID=UPI00136C3255|nr:CPBP family intramembrane glutamic endopeptidase [Pseudomaricurvus sp. HS19]MYM61962.1 CPBP family intramembrane metalloprotease [Pseudomaricurvus sp. HS19]
MTIGLPLQAFLLYVLVLMLGLLVHYRRLPREILIVGMADLCALLLLGGWFLLGVVDWRAALAGAILMLLARFQARLSGYPQGVMTGALVVLCLALALHYVPGLSRWQVEAPQILTPGYGFFSLHLSLDKALVGAALLLYLLPATAARLPRDWLGVALVAPALLVGLAVFLGIRFDPKAGSYLLWFVPINLLITVLAEELFFRRLIQDSIARLIRPQALSALVAILLTSWLFLVAHGIWYPTGTVTMLFAGASLLYAAVYQFSGRVELSILCHFMVNLLHILLLPYPLW